MIPGRKSSQVTLANDDNNTLSLSLSGLGSSRPIRGQARGWLGLTDQWEAQVGLECSHCSQSPTLVVIIAGLTLTHSSLSDQLSPVLGVCCFKALCAHWSLVSIMRTITYRQQTPEQPPPPLTCLQCPQHQVVDTRHSTPKIAHNWSLYYIRQLRTQATPHHIRQENYRHQNLPKDLEDFDA